MLRGCSEKNEQCLLAALSPTDCLFSIFVGPYILDIFRASLKPRWQHGGLFRPSVLQNPLWSPRGAVLVLAQIRTDCRKSGVSTFIIFDELTDDRIHRENKHEMFKLKTEWNKFLFFRLKREKPILYSEPTPTVIKDSQSTSAAYWVQHNILQILWNTQRARLGSSWKHAGPILLVCWAGSKSDPSAFISRPCYEIFITAPWFNFSVSSPHYRSESARASEPPPPPHSDCTSMIMTLLLYD